MRTDQFIACGMYAFDPPRRQAWQSLFEHFLPSLEPLIGSIPELVFEHGETVLREPGLYFGHTCGYPLMTQFKDDMLPFCVPCFDVPGVDGKYYSSRFVVPADSGIETLAQCRGKIVAINSEDSNSGMNLLRHALAKAGAEANYFASVLLTGGHPASAAAVAANRAQLAAIDCVTYQLIADRDPALVANLRSIGFSEKTCGLPFVMPTAAYSPDLGEYLLDALNQALDKMPQTAREILHLLRFEAVEPGDYRSILELEKEAVEAGYAQIN